MLSVATTTGWKSWAAMASAIDCATGESPVRTTTFVSGVMALSTAFGSGFLRSTEETETLTPFSAKTEVIALLSAAE